MEHQLWFYYQESDSFMSPGIDEYHDYFIWLDNKKIPVTRFIVSSSSQRLFMCIFLGRAPKFLLDVS